jgi:hypothetical protein
MLLSCSNIYKIILLRALHERASTPRYFLRYYSSKETASMWGFHCMKGILVCGKPVQTMIDHVNSEVKLYCSPVSPSVSSHMCQ